MMALSNWDTLAFGADGKPSNGEFKHNRTRFSIYKNWLYIWGGKRPMTFEHGHMRFKEFEIHGIRGPQYSGFYLVEYYAKNKTNYFCGIGASGFMSHVEYLSQAHPWIYAKIPEKFLNNDDVIVASSWCSDDPGVENIDFILDGDRYTTDNYPKPDLDILWVGIRPSTVEAFKNWLATILDTPVGKEYLELICTQDGQRFNQGDKFFADHLGGDIPSTAPGESEAPIIGKMI
jgi:hypothetical protein